MYKNRLWEIREILHFSKFSDLAVPKPKIIKKIIKTLFIHCITRTVAII